MERKASAEVQKIQAELTRLKEEQAQKEAEWEFAQKRHDETLCILHSQIGEAERQKAEPKQGKMMPLTLY